MHNGFLTMNKEKMAKSVGNVVTVRDLLQNHRGEVIRLALLSAHYRQPLDWSDETLLQARKRLDGLYDVLDSIEGDAQPGSTPSGEFLDALFDDLNTPKALAVLAEAASAAAKSKANQAADLKIQIQAAGSILGILQHDPDDWLRSGTDRDEIEQLIDNREAARKNKDFAAADKIRDELAARNVEVRDRPNAPPRWVRRIS